MPIILRDKDRRVSAGPEHDTEHDTMNISTRFTLMGAGSILATAAVLTAAGIWQGGVFHAKAQREVDGLVAAELARTARSTYDLVCSQDQSLTNQVAHDQAVAGFIVRQAGGFRLSPAPTPWTAVNQLTQARRTVVLPTLQIGGRPLGRNTDPARTTPVVDQITDLTGARATVFQRLDDGSLLRVATTVRARDGRRAVGTFIPAINPDGRPNPVAASIGRGVAYRGNAFVVNAWYVSEYRPLFDAHGRTIGALYAGRKQEQVQALRRTILETRVGAGGAVAVLSGTGPQRGAYRIPPPGAADGQRVWEARDADGHPYVREIIARALTLAPGRSFTVRYRAPAAHGARPAWHVAEVAYYRPWDWVIVADTRADDFKRFGDRLRAGRTALAWTFLVLGVALAAGAGWFVWAASRRISAGAGEVARAAERLAAGSIPDFCRAIRALGAGDLAGADPVIRVSPLPVRGSDEIGALAAAFNAMQARIGEAVADLGRARGAVRRAREALVAANATLEERVAERTAALRATEERTQLAIEAAHLGTWDLDLDTGRNTKSRSAWRMLGFPDAPADDALTVWTGALHPDDAAWVGARLQAACAGGADYAAEYRAVWPDGSVHWIDSRGQVQRDADGRPRRLLGVCRDVTLEKEMEAEQGRRLAEAQARADRDPLTGLLNHRAFHKCLEEEAERAGRDGHPLAVAVLDLDNFKFFNDAYGHLAGDNVLRQVAEALAGVFRSGDTLARFGGDEFAVLMPGADAEEAARLTAALHAALAAGGYRPPDQETAVPIQVCVGAAVFPVEAAGRLDALALADARLRRAKTGGGGDADDLVERVHTQAVRSLQGFSMLDALVTAVDNKDRYTRRHSEDVLMYSLQIADALGLDERTRQTIGVAALLHDVGKIGVPDRILRKPGKLTDEEFEAVKQHPLMGAVMVGAVPGLEGTLDAVRHHHERWDGGGYPFGLRGEETPLPARLMAVADAFSAMTTDRPYRKGMAHERALAILEEGAGAQWDPEHVRAFVRCRRADETPVGPARPGAETLTAISRRDGARLRADAA